MRRRQTERMRALIEELRAVVGTLPETKWYGTSYDARARITHSRKPFVFLRVVDRGDSLALVFGLRTDDNVSTITSLDHDTKQRIRVAYEKIRGPRAEA